MSKVRASKIVAIAAGLALLGGGGVAAASAASASTSHTSAPKSGHASVSVSTHTGSSNRSRIGTGTPVDAAGHPVAPSNNPAAGPTGTLTVTQAGTAGQRGIAPAVTLPAGATG